MVQLGPQYDLAVRLAAVERQLADIQANGLGQAFSSTQSDGSLGMIIEQDTARSGATAMYFYQGPNTSRDPSTGLHPLLLFIGQLQGTNYGDAGMIIEYPVSLGGLGNGIMAQFTQQGPWLWDESGNVIFSNDTTSNAGLARPYLPYPTPRPTDATKWPTTTQGTWTEVARSYINFQHPKVQWGANLYAPTAVTAQGRLVVTDSSLTPLVTGPTHTISNNVVLGIGDTLTVPAGQTGLWGYLSVQVQVTAGTGNGYLETYGVYGVQS